MKKSLLYLADFTWQKVLLVMSTGGLLNQVGLGAGLLSHNEDSWEKVLLLCLKSSPLHPASSPSSCYVTSAPSLSLFHLPHIIPSHSPVSLIHLSCC